MKVRIKFSKQGDMKFIGHLDLQRFFQKIMRRSGLDMKFSEGFSPHMIMSFASPLGLGVTSDAEYVDMEMNQPVPTKTAVQLLNSLVPEGIRILDLRQIEEGKAGKAMSIVAAADYYVSFKDSCAPAEEWRDKLEGYMAQPEILILKESKKAAKKEEKRGRRGGREKAAEPAAVMTDIKPMIYELHKADEGVFMKLACGSAANLKPETVMESYLAFTGETLRPFSLDINRLELYALPSEDQSSFVSLNDLGQVIE